MKMLYKLTLILLLPLNLFSQTPKALKNSIDSIAKHYDISSIGFAAVKNNQVFIADAVGLNNIETKVPSDEYSKYYIGSTTKTFTALCVMRLIQEGILNLHDTVAKLVPEISIQNKWKESNPVLLIHLLEHTSGFRSDYMHNILASSNNNPSLLSYLKSEDRTWTCRWKPGTRQAYSNPTYGLLGYIVEKYSGMSYVEYVNKMILSPLGMRNSGFFLTDTDKLAISYGGDNKPVMFYNPNTYPAGALYSCPVDMAKYIQFFINETRYDSINSLLSIETFKQMQRPHSIVGAENGLMGYGSALYMETLRGNKSFGHNGFINGYTTDFKFIPDLSTGWYFTMTSSNYDAINALNTLFAKQLLIENTKKEQSWRMTGKHYSGWYQSLSYRENVGQIMNDFTGALKLVQNDSCLVFKSILGNTGSLYPVGGDGLFSFKKGDPASVYISDDENCKIISGCFIYYEQTNFMYVFLRTFLLFISVVIGSIGILVFTVNYIYIKLKKLDTNSKPLFWLSMTFSSSLLIILLMYIDLIDVSKAYSVNLWTILIAFFSVIGAVSIVIGWFSFSKGITHNYKWKRLLLYCTYVSLSFLAVYLAYYQYLPICIWRY